MNTRLQVEHGITEAITGLDLVEGQLLVAAGAELPLRQEQIEMHGHAIEARLCAENPADEFLPSTGLIEYLALPPTNCGVRFDMAYAQGDRVSSHYDSLLGKAIVWGRDRADAVDKIRDTLASTLIAGIHSNVNYLQRLVSSDSYRRAEINTGFISEFMDCDQEFSIEEIHWAVAAVSHALMAHGSDCNNGWRLNGVNRLRIGLNDKASTRQVYLSESGDSSDSHSWKLSVGQHRYIAEVNDATPTRIRITEEDLNDDKEIREFKAVESWREQAGGNCDQIICFEGNKPFILYLTDRVSDYTTTLIGASAASDHQHRASLYSAPMNGTVTAILVAPGKEIQSGTVLMVVEAMKMEFPILSQQKGTVREFYFAVGDSVEQGQTLLDLEES